MTAVLTPNQVAARLDRLPVGHFHRRFLALISLGAWFDYYDNFVASSLVVALGRAGVLQPGATIGLGISDIGLFMAALPLGMFFGTIGFGLASDRVGRRFAFVALLLLYSLATLLGGAGYYPLVAVTGPAVGLALLVITRALAGAGIGAENVVIDVYLSEVMPRQARGWAAAVTHAVAFTAFPAAALLTRLLAPKDAPDGWWMLLVIGSLGALFSWYFRRGLPESPRWSALVGRHAEAERNLARIEAAVEEESGPLPAPDKAHGLHPAGVRHWGEIWSPRLRGRTLMLIAFHLLQTVGYYGFMHWLAVLLQAKQFDYNAVLLLQLGPALLAPLGPILAMWSIERFQRKWLLVGLALAVAAAQLAFGASGDAILLVLIGAGVVVCLNWFSAVFHAYQAELFPTEVRATGVGFTYAWSRLSMVVLSLVMPALIQRDLILAFAVMAGAMTAVALVIGFFGPLTNARSLEEVSPPVLGANKT